MLKLETTYTIPQDVASGAGNFVLATGDSTGYSLHGDFFNGFSYGENGSQSLLNRALTNCPDMNGGEYSVDTDHGSSSLTILCGSIEARKCDVFSFQNMTACVPEMGIVNEPVGDKFPIAKLPGNNPVWCAEDGKLTDPNYEENATMISATPLIPAGWSMIGCLARDKNAPKDLAFPEVGTREIEVLRDMSPQYCLDKCAGYSVSNAFI
jgi:hypothetical protein